MTTTSFRRRAAAVATGTLAAGALSFVPAMAGFGAAHAASGDVAYACDIQMTGGFAQYGGVKDATLTFDTDAADSVAAGATINPTLTTTLALDPAFVAQFGPSPVNRISAALTAATSTAGTAGTSALTFATWERGGGIGSPVPTMVLTGTGAWGDIVAPAEGSVELKAGVLTGTIAMGTTFAPAMSSYPMVCTPKTDDAVVDTIAVSAAAGFGNASCEIDMTSSGFGGKGTYDVEIAHAITAPSSATVGKAFTPTIATTLKFGQPFVDYMVTSPTKTIGVVANATTTVGGAAGTASVDLGEWNRTWTTPTPIGSPIEAIELSGTGSFAPIKPTAAGSLPLSVTGLDGDISMTVSFGNLKSTYPLDCTMNEGAAPATAEVAVAKAPVAAPAATKTAVKTAYAKKAKKLTAKVTVTSAKAKPAGKATLVLKKGKKQVGKATVNIKNGSAKAVFKKIAKGKYKLTVKYAGNKSFKASNKTVTVKIK
jgi:Bacterial Ig-like domain (group 3)